MPVIVAQIMLLAVLAEGFVEYIFGELLHERVMLVVSLAVGVVLALLYQVDILLLVKLEAMHPVVGQVLTGFIISRGSNYVHDLSKRFFGSTNGE